MNFITQQLLMNSQATQLANVSEARKDATDMLRSFILQSINTRNIDFKIFRL